MINTDCFAYSNKNGTESCMALYKLYCKKEECHFYKKVNHNEEESKIRKGG